MPGPGWGSARCSPSPGPCRPARRKVRALKMECPSSGCRPGWWVSQRRGPDARTRHGRAWGGAVAVPARRSRPDGAAPRGAPLVLPWPRLVGPGIMGPGLGRPDLRRSMALAPALTLGPGSLTDGRPPPPECPGLRGATPPWGRWALSGAACVGFLAGDIDSRSRAMNLRSMTR